MGRWDGASGELGSLLAEVRRLGVPAPDARLGVGKRVGEAVWLHRTAADAIGIAPDVAPVAGGAAPAGFRWEVVRWRAADGTLAFIESPDFDAADEPTVGASLLVRPGAAPKLTRPPADPLIWHHKWCMVRPGYGGFDVAASLRRSIAWKRAVGVDRALSNRIGRRSAWLREVVPLLAA